MQQPRLIINTNTTYNAEYFRIKNQESERVQRGNMNQTERKVKTLFGNRYIRKENMSWVDGRGRLVQADAKKQNKTKQNKKKKT